TARRTLDEQLSKLEQADHDEQERAVISQIRTNIGLYTPAMQTLVKDIADGKIKTAAAANEEITPVKEHIRTVEDLAQTLDDNAAKRMHDKKKVIVDVEKNARMVTGVVTGLALVIALMIAIAITRSITQPILTAVEVAEKLAAGDSEQNVRVRGK